MNNDPTAPQPMPGAAPAPAPAPQPAPAPAPAPAAGPQPVVGNPFAPAAGAPAGGAKNNKLPLIIGCSVGGVVLVVLIIVLVLVLGGGKTLTCTASTDLGNGSISREAKIHFNKDNELTGVEESYTIKAEEKITDEQFEEMKKSEESQKKEGKDISVTKISDYEVRVTGKLSGEEAEKEVGSKKYDDIKKRMEETLNMTCKE